MVCWTDQKYTLKVYQFNETPKYNAIDLKILSHSKTPTSARISVLASKDAYFLCLVYEKIF